MQYRFGHAEEQQRDAVAGGEQHREPGREAVLRLGVIRAELDCPSWTGHETMNTRKIATASM
jgi:hypothetical protein